MSDANGNEFELPDGPALWKCKNGACIAMKPRTEVRETERKTTYRCPECKRALHIDWHDEDDEEVAR